MECRLWNPSENPQKRVWKTEFRVSYDTASKEFSFRILGGLDFRFNRYENWSLIWASADGLRVVAAATRVPKARSLESPVIVADFDFSTNRLRQITAGGLADFDPIVYDPIKQECRRLD